MPEINVNNDLITASSLHEISFYFQTASTDVINMLYCSII